MKLNLVGDRVTLRSLALNDAYSIYKNAKDKDIAKYTTLPSPYKLGHAKSFIKLTHKNTRKGKAFELGIKLKGKNEIIGMISLMNIDKENKSAEIGYWLGKKYWRKGIMSESIRIILKFGFKKLRLRRVYAKVMHPNIPSSNLLIKKGFSYEGRLRNATLRKGKAMDDLLYSILREEYIKKNKI